MRFDFGVEGPDPERFEPNRFAIRWTGSIVPPGHENDTPGYHSFHIEPEAVSV